MSTADRSQPVPAAIMLLAVAGATLATAAARGADTDSIRAALEATKPLFDARLRFESVDQEPFADEASAATLRARLGFETGKVAGTSLLVEGEAVVPLDRDYNSTTNGRTAFPVVADPESYELNRLQLANTSLPGTTLTLGRQRIVLDDHRFVGNVGWRQNEQTFDALRVVNRSVKNLTIDVSYLDQVNRVFGRDGLPGANDGRFHGNSVLANVAYQFPAGKLTTFGYLLEFEEAPLPARDSTQTYGARFAGERPVAKLKLGYILSYASQSEYRDNPLDFSADYYLAELTGGAGRYSVGVGYEVLGGDGTKGFTTPLATLHRFQGWADKFLATPVNGIRDAYVNFGYAAKNVGRFDTLGLALTWHDYGSDRLSIDYGSELNAQLQAKFRRVTGTLKYAAYDAARTTPLAVRDTDKVWLQLDFAW